MSDKSDCFEHRPTMILHGGHQGGISVVTARAFVTVNLLMGAFWNVCLLLSSVELLHDFTSAECV